MANCHKFQGPNRVTPIPSGGHTPKAHAYATRLKASKANIFFPKFLFEFLMKNRQAGGSRIRGTVKTPSTFEIKTFWCGKKLLKKDVLLVDKRRPFLCCGVCIMCQSGTYYVWFFIRWIPQRWGNGLRWRVWEVALQIFLVSDGVGGFARARYVNRNDWVQRKNESAEKIQSWPKHGVQREPNLKNCVSLPLGV